MLTQKELKEILSYDPETGLFTRKVTTSNSAIRGSIAGYNSLGSSGNRYCEILYNGTRYKAHNLAWLYMVGTFPKREIDHINRVKYDNRWANLREATRSQNTANSTNSRNKSGYKGVSLETKTGKFKAEICCSYKKYTLGRFNTAEDAARAYDVKAKELFKEFAVLNFKEDEAAGMAGD